MRGWKLRNGYFLLCLKWERQFKCRVAVEFTISFLAKFGKHVNWHERLATNSLDSSFVVAQFFNTRIITISSNVIGRFKSSILHFKIWQQKCPITKCCYQTPVMGQLIKLNSSNLSLRKCGQNKMENLYFNRNSSRPLHTSLYNMDLNHFTYPVEMPQIRYLTVWHTTIEQWPKNCSVYPDLWRFPRQGKKRGIALLTIHGVPFNSSHQPLALQKYLSSAVSVSQHPDRSCFPVVSENVISELNDTARNHERKYLVSIITGRQFQNI